MKRSIAASLATALGAFVHGVATAAVVYDGGAPHHANAVYADANNASSVAATRATFAATTSFSGMNWWGVYAASSAPLGSVAPDSFTLTVYDGSGVAPGALLNTVALGSGGRSTTGASLGLDPEYAYASAFATITLAPGSYFFGLSNAYHQDAFHSWAWEAAATGAGIANLQSGSWFVQPTGGLAFQLTDDAGRVPEPATVLLAGAALVGFGVARRRTR